MRTYLIVLAALLPIGVSNADQGQGVNDSPTVSEPTLTRSIDQGGTGNDRQPTLNARTSDRVLLARADDNDNDQGNKDKDKAKKEKERGKGKGKAKGHYKEKDREGNKDSDREGDKEKGEKSSEHRAGAATEAQAPAAQPAAGPATAPPLPPPIARPTPGQPSPVVAAPAQATKPAATAQASASSHSSPDFKATMERRLARISALDRATAASPARFIAVSKETGVPIATLQAQQAAHPTGSGGILIANEMAKATGKPPGTFLTQRLRGRDWTVIAEENKFDLAPVVPKLERLQASLEAAAKQAKR